MLLTDNEIRQAGVVRSGRDEHYGSTSYDLSIRSIIDSEGKLFVSEGYTVKPQEIVWVTSKERIVLNSDITAHAVIRTSLCNSGLLALNIGIVDPGWNGQLATAIINFSKSEYYLRPGEKFLRLSFYKHSTPTKVNNINKTELEYIQERKKLAIETFGSTFLNVEDLTRRVRESFIGSWKEKTILWGAMGAIIFGFLSIFVAIAAYIIPWNGALYQSNFEDLQERVGILEGMIKKEGMVGTNRETE
ncbi:deoxycytidine triphosphate deaminase [Aminobacter niigataensis]|uniref:Deoxycytidine triphosphate deaminase n=1 Tax=Aminobacter niigataensis TaxID=83265 RepID=A0ABR6L2Y6_9HYPH|nr:hypothetical protein [Aminobacter niigataensis]MBB4650549.1 deoxycytidine triphosphate deaminase [Aminobacter niigataensis]